MKRQFLALLKDKGEKFMDNILDDFDYGETQLNLNKIFKEKNINIRKMCREIKVDYHVVDRYRNGEVRRVDVDVLTRICCYLNIGFDELITYVPPKNDDDMDEEIF